MLKDVIHSVFILICICAAGCGSGSRSPFKSDIRFDWRHTGGYRSTELKVKYLIPISLQKHEAELQLIPAQILDKIWAGDIQCYPEDIPFGIRGANFFRIKNTQDVIIHRTGRAQNKNIIKNKNGDTLDFNTGINTVEELKMYFQNEVFFLENCKGNPGCVDSVLKKEISYVLSGYYYRNLKTGKITPGKEIGITLYSGADFPYFSIFMVDLKDIRKMSLGKDLKFHTWFRKMEYTLIPRYIWIEGHMYPYHSHTIQEAKMFQDILAHGTRDEIQEFLQQQNSCEINTNSELDKSILRIKE